MGFETIELSKIEEYNISSISFEIDLSKKYEFSSSVICSKGEKHCGYLIMIFLDKDEKEVRRRIKFITDFSGIRKEYKIISDIPLGAKFIKIGFRINVEGAIKSDVSIQLPTISELKVEAVGKSTLEEYDDTYNYYESWKGVDLERDFYKMVGGHKTVNEFLQQGEYKVYQLTKHGFKSHHNLLDIGCGVGILMEPLKRIGVSSKNYVGIDISDEAIEFCKKKYPNYEFYVCKNNTIPQLERKFDVICLFSIFTHLWPQEIIHYLKQMKYILKEVLLTCRDQKLILNRYLLFMLIFRYLLTI